MPTRPRVTVATSAPFQVSLPLSVRSMARIEAREAPATVFRLPRVRLDPERPSRPRGHEFSAQPGVWVVWG